MKKILAPHKEQDGWVYVRVLKVFGRWDILPWGMFAKVCFGGELQTQDASYFDCLPGHRIISSRKVERAVETDDFLRLCAEEGLTVTYYGDLTTHPCLSRKWFVESGYQGDTLREAYYRYHAAADDTRPWLEHTDVIRAG